MAAPAASMPFIKNLASSDRKIRIAAIDSLKGFLAAKYGAPSSTRLTFSDAQKLWAGLFYALWMADRAPAQQRLCDELAGLPKAVGLPDAAVAAWLRAFWATMAREWTTGIDVLRMEKFMLLVRRVLNAQLAWMRGDAPADAQAGGPAEEKRADSAARALGLEILAQWPLNVEGEAELEAAASESDSDDSNGDEDGDDSAVAGRPRKKPRKVAPTLHIPVGLTMHVVDIWVDEAEKLGLLRAPQKRGAPPTLAAEINALVEALAAKTTAPAVRQRTRDALADERLPWVESAAAQAAAGGGGIEGQADSDDGDADGDGDWEGFND